MQSGLLDWMQEDKKNISVKKTVKSKFSLFSNLVECVNDNLLVLIIVPRLCKMQYKLWERHIELSTIFQLFCKSKSISKYLFFKMKSLCSCSFIARFTLHHYIVTIFHAIKYSTKCIFWSIELPIIWS